MLWENTFPEGYGRGALTEEEIFMPSGENDIIKISNIDGAIKDQITVMPEGNQPVGNLFSNGENIFILSSISSFCPIDAHTSVYMTSAS